jgi:UV DNA damage endonuclease
MDSKSWRLAVTPAPKNQLEHPSNNQPNDNRPGPREHDAAASVTAVGQEFEGVRPALGLVCITQSDEVRYRTITRTRYLALADDQTRFEALRVLYQSNLSTLFKAIEYCAQHRIGLYRIPSSIFPMSDLIDGIGEEVLNGLASDLCQVRPMAERASVRLTVHPEQYVVLNSESLAVVKASVVALEHQGRIFDRFGLPRSAWAAMNIHCGKSGRPNQMIDALQNLHDCARSRVTLENDERSYGAEATLAICRAANVPMIFDLHHHVVMEKTAINDSSIPKLIERAATTWSPKAWQIVHVSSGRSGPSDPRHHDFITALPIGLERVPWVEVEAKAKEAAIDRLRADLSTYQSTQQSTVTS